MVLNSLDWILVAVIILMAVLGYRKGFIKSAGSVISILAGLWAGLTYWQPVTAYLQKNYMMVSIFDDGIQQMMPVPAFDSLEGMVPSLFESVQYAYQGATHQLAQLIVSALVFILLIIGVAGVLKVVWSILSILFNWGILGTVNRLGGTAFELAKGILVFSIGAGVVVPIVRALAKTNVPSAVTAQAYLETSTVLPYLENIFRLMGRITGV